jgi:predicted metal-dependent peptidase
VTRKDVESKLAEDKAVRQRNNEGDEIPKDLREELDLPK